MPQPEDNLPLEIARSARPDNAQLARRWFDEVWNQRKDATLLELLDPKIQGKMEGLDVTSREDFIEARKALLDGLPDLAVAVEDVVAEGDQAVVRWSASGTHRGDGLGVKASGRRVSFRGMTWLTFAQGRIVRGWDSWNQGLLMQQLGSPGFDRGVDGVARSSPPFASEP